VTLRERAEFGRPAAADVVIPTGTVSSGQLSSATSGMLPERFNELGTGTGTGPLAAVAPTIGGGLTSSSPLNSVVTA